MSTAAVAVFPQTSQLPGIAPRRGDLRPVTTPRDVKPFVKWVGGKRRLVPEIMRQAPASFGNYHEPFVGGGAVFFSLVNGGLPQSGRTYLSDVNERLVRTWRGIRDDVEGVILRLRDYEVDHGSEQYYAIRALDVDSMSDDADVAAWFIYLNKTGFNGLYRVNRKGGFNVPIGRYARPNICPAENLRACSDVLRGVDVRHQKYDAVLERAVPGDLVYFDPPYVPVSKTANFTSYTRDGFSLDDQAHLRDVALELKNRGVSVILSNSDTRPVRELYARGFKKRQIFASRALNSAGDRRGAVPELVIW